MGKDASTTKINTSMLHKLNVKIACCNIRASGNDGVVFMQLKCDRHLEVIMWYCIMWMSTLETLYWITDFFRGLNRSSTMCELISCLNTARQVRAAFKHKTKVWTLTSSSIRNINVKPFNSDIVSSSSCFHLYICVLKSTPVALL